jgi:hypothetical protein
LSQTSFAFAGKTRYYRIQLHDQLLGKIREKIFGTATAPRGDSDKSINDDDLMAK